LLNVAMKAAVRPIDDPADMTVLHWIEVNVVDVPLEIGIISNRMFPITALPDAFFSLRNLAFRSWLGFETA